MTQALVLQFAPEYDISDAFNCECDPTGAQNPSATLAELRSELATRMGYGGQVSSGVLPPGVTAKFNSIISSAQLYLYRRYDVLRTERFFTWPLTTGVRFYDLPNNLSDCPVKLDPREVTWAGIEYKGLWYRIACGIPPELYSFLAPRFPTRYEIRECIEVYPPPIDDLFQLQIKGRYAPAAMTADTDKCIIDDRIVFLQALSDAKADAGHPDAQRYSQEAELMIRGMVAGAHETRRYLPGGNRFVERLPTTWVRKDGTVVTGT
jgi:hypothetical protein